MPRHQHRDGGISYDEGARLYREGGGRRPMSEASDDYPVDKVAHAWLVKMRGENPEAHRGEFDDWLSALPDQKAACERTEERRGGQACGRTGKFRWSPENTKKKK